MYDETKYAVKQALWASKVLFTMDRENFNRLVRITNNIDAPSNDDIQKLIEDNSLTKQEAIALWFKNNYSIAAVNAGFSKEQGIAMLKYAALIKETS
jgi:predicted NACHT family NTPase